MREVIAEELIRIDDERLGLVAITAIDVDSEMNRAIVFYDSLVGEDGDDEIVEALAEHRVRIQASRRPAGAGEEDAHPDASSPTTPSAPPSASSGSCTTRTRCPSVRPSRRRRRHGDTADGPASPPTVHGLAVVDKPAGVTSHDVVGMLRRRFGERQVGHAGTLDPDATGVLLVGVGSCTRLLRFLTDLGKTYTGQVVFGSTTDSLDSTGVVTGTFDMAGLTAEQVRAAVAEHLVGPILQIPPMVSAVKVDGRRLHELAREGVEIEREPRPGHRAPVRRRAHRRPARLRHRGALLEGHLHPHAGRRSRPAVRRRRAPARPAPHRGRRVHASAEAASPDDGASCCRCPRRCATTRRSSSTPTTAALVRNGAGRCRRASRATARGRCSAPRASCWRCTRRSARPGEAGRGRRRPRGVTSRRRGRARRAPSR